MNKHDIHSTSLISTEKEKPNSDSKYNFYKKKHNLGENVTFKHFPTS